MATGDDGTSERSRPRWLGWTLGLLAVPVLYVLTAPPLVWGLDTRWGTREHVGAPDWLKEYLVPYHWFRRSELLKPYLDRYSDWWRLFFLSRIEQPLKKSGKSLFMSG